MTRIIPQSEWVWSGFAEHLIVSRECLFHLATYVGDYLVSTVGAYQSMEMEIAKRWNRVSQNEIDSFEKCLNVDDKGNLDIGMGRKFETMVFRLGMGICSCGCGQRRVEGWGEITMRGYNDAYAARLGHMQICEAIARGENPEEIELDETPLIVQADVKLLEAGDDV